MSWAPPGLWPQGLVVCGCWSSWNVLREQSSLTVDSPPKRTDQPLLNMFSFTNSLSIYDLQYLCFERRVTSDWVEDAVSADGAFVSGVLHQSPTRKRGCSHSSSPTAASDWTRSVALWAKRSPDVPGFRSFSHPEGNKMFQLRFETIYQNDVVHFKLMVWHLLPNNKHIQTSMCRGVVLFCVNFEHNMKDFYMRNLNLSSNYSRYVHWKTMRANNCCNVRNFSFVTGKKHDYLP